MELEMQLLTEKKGWNNSEQHLRHAAHSVFQMGPYTIVMYLSKPRRAIECNEHGHRLYDG